MAAVLLGGLCDDVDGEIEMQSEGLTAALDALRVLRDTDRANDAAHATRAFSHLSES